MYAYRISLYPIFGYFGWVVPHPPCQDPALFVIADYTIPCIYCTQFAEYPDGILSLIAFDLWVNQIQLCLSIYADGGYEYLAWFDQIF